MKLPIAYYGNPILRKKAARVETITDEIRQLVKDMEETMHALDGIGLAAPQIKHSLALFITYVSQDEAGNEADEEDIPPVVRVYINPKIIEYSQEEGSRDEGCLSIPLIYGNVIRPRHIKIEATDLEGNLFTKTLSDLPARNFLHENDHINGVLFIDRIRGKEREEIDKSLRKIKKELHKKS